MVAEVKHMVLDAPSLSMVDYNKTLYRRQAEIDHHYHFRSRVDHHRPEVAAFDLADDLAEGCNS